MIYQTPMTLAEAKIKEKYQILSLNLDQNSTLLKRAKQLGFLPGAIVECTKKAPITKDPLVIKIKNSCVAISKREASYIEVTKA